MYNASAFAETPKTPKSFPRDFAGMLQASRKTFWGLQDCCKRPKNELDARTLLLQSLFGWRLPEKARGDMFLTRVIRT